jgi:hypothetical protein
MVIWCRAIALGIRELATGKTPGIKRRGSNIDWGLKQSGANDEEDDDFHN